MVASPKSLRVLSVFLASPSDLADERDSARRVVDRLNVFTTRMFNWRIELLGWEETAPGFVRPQELINADVRRCDLFLGVLWRRWGTPTGGFSSGFAEEFYIAEARNKIARSPDIWLFFKRQDVSAATDPQVAAVERFKSDHSQRALFKEFGTTEEWSSLLRELLLMHVASIALGTVGRDVAIDIDNSFFSGAVNELYHWVERVQDSRTHPAFVKTGLVDLDAIIGGVRAGDCTLITSAPPSDAGHVLLSLARSMSARGLRAYMWLPGWNRQRTWLRIISMSAMIPWQRLAKGLLSEADYYRLVDCFSELEATPLQLDVRPTSSLDDVRLGLEAQPEVFRPEVILFTPTVRTAYGTLRLDARPGLLASVRELAATMQIPIVVAALHGLEELELGGLSDVAVEQAGTEFPLWRCKRERSDATLLRVVSTDPDSSMDSTVILRYLDDFHGVWDSWPPTTLSGGSESVDKDWERDRGDLFSRVRRQARQLSVTDPAAAHALYAETLRRFPAAPRAFVRDYARFLWRQNAGADLIDDLLQNVLAFAPTPESLVEYARFLDDVREDPQRADRFYKRAARLDVRYFGGLLSRARWFATRSPDHAERLFRQALRTRPTSLRAIGKYAAFRLAVRRDAVGAEALYQISRRLAGSERSLTRYSAEVARYPGHTGIAASLYQRAVREVPAELGVLLSYAEFAIRVQKDNGLAEDLLRQVIERSPTDIRALAISAVFHDLVLANHSKATDFIARAEAVDPALAFKELSGCRRRLRTCGAQASKQRLSVAGAGSAGRRGRLKPPIRLGHVGLPLFGSDQED